MSTRRLLLVNPANPRRAGYASSARLRFPPLALQLLAALTPPSWEVEIQDEKQAPFAYREADLVGLTAYTSAANRAYEIAGGYRGLGVPVVMGGPHASACVEEALEHVDSVVVGEAEGVWPRLLEDRLGGRLQPVYRGAPPELAGLPLPRRDLTPRAPIALVQASRGCPLDCDFCAVTGVYGPRQRRRPAGEVLDELATLPGRLVFFADDNLFGHGGEGRRAAVELLEGMVRRRLGLYWGCQSSVGFADDEELLRLAARAGCRVVFVGFESDSPEALAELHKPSNVRHCAGSYAAALHRIHRAGMVVVGGYLAGLDSDTPDALRRRLDEVLACGADVAQLAALTPFPGTRLLARVASEGRLLCHDFPRDWDLFDGMELVHRPRHVEPAELREIMREFVRRAGRLSTCLRRASATLADSRNPVTAVVSAWMGLGYRPIRLAMARARELPWECERRAPGAPAPPPGT